MKRFFLPIFALFFFWFTFAHQPRLVFQQPSGHIVDVKNPEVSQAFYGILSWQEDVYQIVSDTGFLLYVNIVVPDISWRRTDFTVDIREGDDAIYTRLDGKAAQWSGFFEKFAGDQYLQWPKRERPVGPGTYTIKVSNTDNQGKYSLAIGKRESFPFSEMVKTMKAIPDLKMVFFEKPRYTILRNYIWLMVWVTIIVFIIFIWWIIKLVKYVKSK